MSSKKTKFGLAFVATALVFVVLTSVFWEFMRDTIVMPIYYLIWVSDLILKSISQEAYLAFLILISLVIVGNTLNSIKTPSQITQHSLRNRSIDSARYLFWRRLCDDLTGSQFSREHFALEARRLILSILTYQEELDTSQVEAMVMDGTLNVPNAVKNLIQQREIQPSRQTSPAITYAVFRLRRLLFKAQSPTDPQIDHQVDEIVGFIERRLEVTLVEKPPQSRT